MVYVMTKYTNPRVVNSIGGIVVFDEDEGGERHLDPGTPEHDEALAGVFGAVAPYVPPPPPTPPDPRDTAELPRAEFCKALRRAGILPASEAVIAAQGGWPDTFAAFVTGLTPDEAADAQIDWAAAVTIRYTAPLLQHLALGHSGGDQAAATALLDGLFGID